MKKVFCLILFINSTHTIADEVMKDDLSKSDVVESFRSNISDYINKASINIDEFIGDPSSSLILDNKSYGVLNIKQKVYSDHENETQIDFKLKVDLPHSKKRLNLFLDTNSDDFESLENKTFDSYIRDKSFLDDYKSTIGGIALVDNNGRWKKKYKIGLKLETPINPFVKANFTNSKKIKNNLFRDFKQSVFYYNDDGFGVNSTLDYYCLVESGVIYNSTTSIQFLDKNDYWEFSQNFSALKKIDENHSIKYNIGSGFNTKPDLNLNRNKYWINFQYRYNLYNNWMFLKVTPDITLKDERNFNVDYGVLFNIEMIFKN